MFEDALITIPGWLVLTAKVGAASIILALATFGGVVLWLFRKEIFE